MAAHKMNIDHQVLHDYILDDFIVYITCFLFSFIELLMFNINPIIQNT